MNKNVLRIMIILVITFLTGMYILKFAFPEEFVMVITLDSICKIGTFVDENLWLHIILGTLTSFITYWLYTCAAAHKPRLGWLRAILTLIISVSVQITYYYVDPTLSNALSVCAMLALPAMAGAPMKSTALIFCTHYAAQYLSLKIRSLPLYLTSVNYATILLMGLECYFWLLLFYFYYNYKGEKKNG